MAATSLGLAFSEAQGQPFSRTPYPNSPSQFHFISVSERQPSPLNFSKKSRSSARAKSVSPQSESNRFLFLIATPFSLCVPFFPQLRLLEMGILLEVGLMVVAVQPSGPVEVAFEEVPWP
ncbi:uncharacterized protein LOC114195163 [Vigna unguiculata]|uniref:uncharacterized protein LOC114195163 n=1 Tax=Vigna unguiculata TaxID=3917 RepID=UPI0010166BE4|nr:uncharacterized protein LOC114195163 [Vigna unguiculata]